MLLRCAASRQVALSLVLECATCGVDTQEAEQERALKSLGVRMQVWLPREKSPFC